MAINRQTIFDELGLPLPCITLQKSEINIESFGVKIIHLSLLQFHSIFTVQIISISDTFFIQTGINKNFVVTSCDKMFIELVFTLKLRNFIDIFKPKNFTTSINR